VEDTQRLGEGLPLGILMALTAKDLEGLLVFYLASESGRAELRLTEEREVELKPIIDQGFINLSSPSSAVYGYTTGYVLTKVGRAAVEAAVEATNGFLRTV
jgi:hypothetical protein